VQGLGGRAAARPYLSEVGASLRGIPLRSLSYVGQAASLPVRDWCDGLVVLAASYQLLASARLRARGRSSLSCLQDTRDGVALSYAWLGGCAFGVGCIAMFVPVPCLIGKWGQNTGMHVCKSTHPWLIDGRRGRWVLVVCLRSEVSQFGMWPNSGVSVFRCF
jgi:hypothetical protein